MPEKLTGVYLQCGEHVQGSVGSLALVQVQETASVLTFVSQLIIAPAARLVVSSSSLPAGSIGWSRISSERWIPVC